MRTDYILQVLRLLQETYARQQETLQTAATWIADALASDGVLYVFGASHAGIITEELAYRAGGLVPVSPIFIPGLTCDVRPLPLTSALERIDGYALAVVKHIPISPSDVVLVHSVSGRNAAPVEVALHAKQQGAKVIALTALDYSQSVSPRSSRMAHASATMAFTSAAPSTVETGATGCGKPASCTIASPRGAPLSITKSATSNSRYPVLERGETDCE